MNNGHTTRSDELPSSFLYRIRTLRLSAQAVVRAANTFVHAPSSGLSASPSATSITGSFIGFGRAAASFSYAACANGLARSAYLHINLAPTTIAIASGTVKFTGGRKYPS